MRYRMRHLVCGALVVAAAVCVRSDAVVDAPWHSGVAVASEAAVDVTGTISAHPHACQRRFTVLTVFSASEAVPVCEMFHEIAVAVYGALQTMGLDVLLACCALGASTCVDGREYAAVVRQRQVVLLGTGALLPMQRDDQPVQPCDVAVDPKGCRNIPARAAPLPAVVADGWLPRDLIWYQFDHVSKGSLSGFDAVIYGDYLGMARHFRVWDYSRSNVVHLRDDHGIEASHCPMGYDPVYTVPQEPGSATPIEDIDVLFFGSPTPYRQALFQQLRAVGLTVVIAPYRLWGRQLVEAMRRAAIILVPSAWGNPGEFKMSRLAPILANARFALVEDTAVAEDIAPFRDGLAVLPANEMALAAKHYLAHPELRREVAERGQRLFAGQAAADVLRPCVRSLLEAAGCSGVAAGDGW